MRAVSSWPSSQAASARSLRQPQQPAVQFSRAVERLVEEWPDRLLAAAGPDQAERDQRHDPKQ